MKSKKHKASLLIKQIHSDEKFNKKNRKIKNKKNEVNNVHEKTEIRMKETATFRPL